MGTTMHLLEKLGYGSIFSSAREPLLLGWDEDGGFGAAVKPARSSEREFHFCQEQSITMKVFRLRRNFLNFR